MSDQSFAECYAGRVERTVDAVLADLQTLGSENLKKFLAWFRGLSDADRALFLALTGIVASVVLKILTKAVSQTVAVGVTAFFGGASWVLLVRAAIDCEDLL